MANDRIYAVGAAGTLLEFDGTAWSRMSSPTAAEMQDIGGIDSDVYSVGAGGVIIRLAL